MSFHSISSSFGYPSGPVSEECYTNFVDALKANINAVGLHERYDINRGTSDLNIATHRDYERNLIFNFKEYFKLPLFWHGYVSTSATEGLLLGAWAASNWTRDTELAVILVTDNTHASVYKSLEITGLIHRFELINISSCAIECNSLTSLIDRFDKVIVFLTCWNPLTLRCDEISDLSMLIKSSKTESLIIVDAAYGGIMQCLIEDKRMDSWNVDLIAIDCHKGAGAPIGTGITIFDPALTKIVRIDSNYLPYGEDSTVLTSRNFAFVVAANTVLQHLNNGDLNLQYEKISYLDEFIHKNLGDYISISRFPCYLFEINKSILNDNLITFLGKYDIYPIESYENNFLIRFVLDPGSDQEELKYVVNYLSSLLTS